MAGPNAGRCLRQPQQWPLLRVGVVVGVEPAAHHQPFRLVTEDGADDVRHQVPGREEQPFRRVFLALERSFQRPVRQRGRHPQQPPQPLVDQLPDQLPQLGMPRVDAAPRPQRRRLQERRIVSLERIDDLGRRTGRAEGLDQQLVELVAVHEVREIGRRLPERHRIRAADGPRQRIGGEVLPYIARGDGRRAPVLAHRRDQLSMKRRCGNGRRPPRRTTSSHLAGPFVLCESSNQVHLRGARRSVYIAAPDPPGLQPPVEPRDEEHVPQPGLDGRRAGKQRVRQRVSQASQPHLVERALLLEQIQHAPHLVAVARRQIEPGQRRLHPAIPNTTMAYSQHGSRAPACRALAARFCRHKSLVVVDKGQGGVWPPEATSKRKPQGLGLTRDDRTEIGPGVWRTAKGRISGFCEVMPAASRGNPGRGDRLLFSHMEKVRIEARLPAALADQARAFVAEGCATDLDELLAEALRRFLESHAAELTDAFMKEDVQWGLREND